MKLKQLNLGRGLIFGALGMFPLGLSWGLTGYLEIGDIPGESQRTGHEDEIDFCGLEWRIERLGATTGSTRDRGAAEVKPMEEKMMVGSNGENYFMRVAVRGSRQ